MAFKRNKKADNGEIVIDAEVEESASTGGNMPVRRDASVPQASDVRAVASKHDKDLAVRSVAVATAGGLAAGAATIAVAAVAKTVARPLPGLARRRKRDIVASRSFLVDVHMLKSHR